MTIVTVSLQKQLCRSIRLIYLFPPLSPPRRRWRNAISRLCHLSNFMLLLAMSHCIFFQQLLHRSPLRKPCNAHCYNARARVSFPPASGKRWTFQKEVRWLCIADLGIECSSEHEVRVQWSVLIYCFSAAISLLNWFFLFRLSSAGWVLWRRLRGALLESARE